MTLDWRGEIRHSSFILTSADVSSEGDSGYWFINKHVKCIELDQRLVVPRKGNKVLILASLSKKPIGTTDHENKLRPNKSVCEVAKMKIIPPYFEAFVLLITRAARTYVPGIYRTDRVQRTILVAKSVARVTSNWGIYTMVTNLPNLTINVPKRTNVAEPTKCSPSVAAMMKDCSERDEWVTVILIVKKKGGKKTLIREHQTITKTDAEKTKEDLQDQVNFNARHDEYCSAF